MNFNELKAIKERTLLTMGPREATHDLANVQERTVLVCGGTGCTSGKSKVIFKEFKDAVAKAGLTEKVKVIMTGCFGLCALGPVVIVYPEGAFYSQVQPEYVDEIVKQNSKYNKKKGYTVVDRKAILLAISSVVKDTRLSYNYRYEMYLYGKSMGYIQ